jgi:glutathione S-transferase
MSDIVIYGFPFSPYVRSVTLALQIKDVPYRQHYIDLRPVEGGLGSAGHRALHPFARVPILEDDDFRIYETQAIVRYLDAKYPQSPLQPTEPRAIGRMSQMLGVLDCYLFSQGIRPVGAERVVRPALMGATPDETKVAKALGDIAVCISALEQLVSGDHFLLGEMVSLADIMLAPQLHLILPVPEVRAMLKGTRLAAWLERMLEHPAMLATMPPSELRLPVRLIELEAA